MYLNQLQKNCFSIILHLLFHGIDDITKNFKTHITF